MPALIRLLSRMLVGIALLVIMQILLLALVQQLQALLQTQLFALANKLALQFLLQLTVAEILDMSGHQAVLKFQVPPPQLFQLQEQVPMMLKLIQLQ